MSYGPQKAQQGSSGPLCRFLAVSNPRVVVSKFTEASSSLANGFDARFILFFGAYDKSPDFDLT